MHLHVANSNQYPVASPFNSTIFGKTFLKCLTYLVHLATSTVSQN